MAWATLWASLGRLTWHRQPGAWSLDGSKGCAIAVDGSRGLHSLPLTQAVMTAMARPADAVP